MGKTTACGKLALHLMKLKKSVMLVATDVYRPAAIDQLQKLGQVSPCLEIHMQLCNGHAALLALASG